MKPLTLPCKVKQPWCPRTSYGCIVLWKRMVKLLHELFSWLFFFLGTHPFVFNYMGCMAAFGSLVNIFSHGLSLSFFSSHLGKWSGTRNIWRLELWLVTLNRKCVEVHFSFSTHFFCKGSLGKWRRIQVLLKISLAMIAVVLQDNWFDCTSKIIGWIWYSLWNYVICLETSMECLSLSKCWDL